MKPAEDRVNAGAAWWARPVSSIPLAFVALLAVACGPVPDGANVRLPGKVMEDFDLRSQLATLCGAGNASLIKVDGELLTDVRWVDDHADFVGATMASDPSVRATPLLGRRLADSWQAYQEKTYHDSRGPDLYRELYGREYRLAAIPYSAFTDVQPMIDGDAEVIASGFLLRGLTDCQSERPVTFLLIDQMSSTKTGS